LGDAVGVVIAARADLDRVTGGDLDVSAVSILAVAVDEAIGIVGGQVVLAHDLAAQVRGDAREVVVGQAALQLGEVAVGVGEALAAALDDGPAGGFKDLVAVGIIAVVAGVAGHAAALGAPRR